ncbi:helicase-exonuclease AddAB subunit AddA [Aneurinibacillus terranovensis]|uniref:helicase-exonuclease AddAB subunit AddA n=1 Tax=Aneurinibacillus terranovensis TaxID=278991 RepID=UPI0003FBDD24|nr:helicase-exonuclease AddAB subunit AddA [Aneurinibacillus terranovensis]
MIKPENSTWTDEQWEAIASRDTNTLVAAAAGSGKTAVLVERIIRRILEEERPVDVDRLLVVTFTKAAASEMRQRIGAALDKALAANPASLHLRRQLTLLNRSSIMTLHSFCMEVLKKYYYFLDLDPGFRIADDTEAFLMRQDTLEQLFEEEYGNADPVFFQLVDAYAGDRNDAALQRLVQKLYDFSRSHPWPDAWLDDMADMFTVSDLPTFFQRPWFHALHADVLMELRGSAALLQLAADISESEGGPLPYVETIRKDQMMLHKLCLAADHSWQALFDAFSGIHFDKLKPCRGDGYDKSLQDKVKDIREQVKKRVQSLQAELFRISPEEYLENVRQNAPLVRKLVELVKSFEERYRMAKREKGLVDFADLEHFCLQILRHPSSTPEKLEPSVAALDYRVQFSEILVDEYQDTNLVQEAIVRLVSRDDESGGNLFMVGDVKQSIYRFRLAEPGLFLAKYKTFMRDGSGPGKRIDLAKNFRSRREVVDGTNFIFRQIMNETVSEIAYDEAAELVLGAADYPETAEVDHAVELLLIDRNVEKDDETHSESGADAEADETAAAGEGTETSPDPSEWEIAQLEARLIARKIKEIIGGANGKKHLVYDKQTKSMRPVMYRDIVILLRASSEWAPTMAEEFRLEGIPAYAEISTGYFSATEVEVMTSLLRVIDNPFQDIPLAGVLRSPIVQLTAEDLAQIRLASNNGSFYEAVLAYVRETHDAEENHLQEKLEQFIEQLNRWRTEARQGALSSLIWQIYGETGYYDFAGGLPGGRQRQANLRALYDRALQYESTSFRGLFRFLRFIERMRDQGSDLGTARALSEQEDVVRIMTIHKSKGLEFPVVFVAGLAKSFNFMDVNGSFLLHKELGLGPKYVDTNLRISYPSLPFAAMKRRMRIEQLAEEMRILYVALTRAREKLYLVGTVKKFDKMVRKWSGTVSWPHWTLPDYELVRGRCYLDWIGPALMRHREADDWLACTGEAGRADDFLRLDASVFTCSLYRAEELVQSLDDEKEAKTEIEHALANGLPVPYTGPHREDVESRLAWQYGYSKAQAHLAKQSVSELKRRMQALMIDEAIPVSRTGIFRRESAERPQFLSEKKINAAERGTAMHTVMQHLPQNRAVTGDELEQSIRAMVSDELLSEAEAEAIDRTQIEEFYRTSIGGKLLAASNVEREIPFTLALPADEAYPDWTAGSEEERETILLQGVIDCLIDMGDSYLLLDYKTDDTAGISDSVLAERYRIQLDWYAKAVERIANKPVREKVLYFFDGSRTIYIDNENLKENVASAKT